jgi:hypothetical protein
MKRIIKKSDSEIIKKSLNYKTNADNSELRKILLKEQKNFCAYTEEYIGYNDANDVEHFNPNLKDTKDDTYLNWFNIKHKPNNVKRSNWVEPILHPTSLDFEERIIYHEGMYLHKPNDIEAKNLIDLLKLNEEIFVKDRIRYINRRKERISERKINPEEYFDEKIKRDIDQIKYLRAIQEEFGIDIWNIIPEITD